MKKSPAKIKNPSKTAKKVAKASGLREQSKKLLKSARNIADVLKWFQIIKKLKN